MSTPTRTPPRRYGLDKVWSYQAAQPVPDPGANLIPVYWGGLPLNGGDDPNTGLCSVIENVTGWLDSPPLNGNDAARAVADGSAWGPKTLGARTIVLSGACTGPRPQLGAMRDQLAALACSRDTAPLAITDSGVGRTLTADTRAGTDQFQLTWLSPIAYRWQVTLTAADPVLYEDTWQQAELITTTPGGSGRTYQRTYGWQYASPTLPNSALLPNSGNWPAPVYVLYTGDLSASVLTDESGGVINVDVLQPGSQLALDTSTLTAQAAGGLSRASFILPGSVPMLIPPAMTVRWHLHATGAGSLVLSWRSAWV
jgi:hypothetical protein